MLHLLKKLGRLFVQLLSILLHFTIGLLQECIWSCWRSAYESSGISLHHRFSYLLIQSIICTPLFSTIQFSNTFLLLFLLLATITVLHILLLYTFTTPTTYLRASTTTLVSYIYFLVFKTYFCPSTAGPITYQKLLSPIFGFKNSLSSPMSDSLPKLVLFFSLRPTLPLFFTCPFNSSMSKLTTPTSSAPATAPATAPVTTPLF